MTYNEVREAIDKVVKALKEGESVSFSDLL
jgi:hypothetical protein